MIVVKLELWPNGIEAAKQDLGVMKISNDGTGTAELGNYQVVIMRGAKYSKRPGAKYSKRPGIWRQCAVSGFPRDSVSAGPWDLLRAALNRALGRRWQP